MSAVETSEEHAALTPPAPFTGDDVIPEDRVQDDEGMVWTDLAAASEEEMAEPSEDPDPPVPPTVVVLGTENEEDEDSFSPLLKATKAGLDAMGLSYTVHPENDDDVTAITCKGNISIARDIPIRFLIKESTGLFMLMLNLPILVPEEHRTNISKYWTHVNYNINVGNFEMDFRDGEVRFRVTMMLKYTPLSPEMVKDTVMLAGTAANQYLPGQFLVIYGDKDFETAYQIARSYD